MSAAHLADRARRCPSPAATPLWSSSSPSSRSSRWPWPRCSGRKCWPPPEGTENMRSIGQAVQEGAQAYLTRQFKTLAVFAAVAFLLLFVLPGDAEVRIGRSVFFLAGRRLLGRDRLHGHVAGREGERARGRCRPGRGPRPGDARRVPHRRRRRHGDRRPRPARRLARRADLQERRPVRARGLRLRRRPARHVHACRRRHLHQGRRRRRRPGRQGRAEHPRGRPAQRRDDRRQRRRQRRRLRRYGGRPLRVVRRDAGRRADPRQGRLRRRGPGLPADRPRHRRDHRDHRRLPHAGRARARVG